MNQNVQLIEIPSELGAGTRGASLGSAALRVAANNVQNRFFKHYPPLTVAVENDRLLDDTPYPFAKRIDGVVRIYENFLQTAVPVMQQHGAFTVVLAGDHSTGGATIAALRAAHPDKRLGVIWVDAHADLHTPYTTPSGNMHGMPLALSLGLDNLDMQHNTPDDATKVYWNTLKNMGGLTPKIQPHELVFVAVRSTEPEEDYLLARHNIRQYSVDDVRTQGANAIAHAIRQYLGTCDILYISFDVDSMDCDLVSRGTGTPVPNGLTPAEAQDLILGLLDDERTRCLEVTEVNPCLDDKCNKMADTAFSILETAVRAKSTAALAVK